MMHAGHPDELELLEYADGARSSRAREVAAHVAGCARCADLVHELQAGKAALRAAPRLELSDRRRAEISHALQARGRGRRANLSTMRLAAVLAPVAAAAAVVVLVAQLGETSRGDEAGGLAGPAGTTMGEDDAAGGAAEEGAGAGAEAAPSAGEDRSALAGGPVASVAGPPAEVVTLLRSEGFTARVSGGRVVVSDADPTEVLEALRGRARGRVAVVLE